MIYSGEEKKLVLLLKRFLKESGLYNNSDFCRESVKHMLSPIWTGESEYFTPFDWFDWDETEEGEMYWYHQILKWAIFLYDTFKDDKDLFCHFYNGDAERFECDLDVVLTCLYPLCDLDYETKMDYDELEKRFYDLGWADEIL